MDEIKTYHDLKNSIERFKIMSELILDADFSSFTKEELHQDIQKELDKLKELFKKIS